jgi:hypothetical protein
MNRSLCIVRRVLLIALVSWGVVDDLFPTAPNPLDLAAENDAYLPPESAGSRNERSTKSASLRVRSRLIDRPIGSPAAHSAVSNAAPRCALSSADRLYALMSLQR